MKKAIFTFLGFSLLISLLVTSYVFVKEDRRGLADEADPVYTYFYKTQTDADCILIKQGDANILIDTGEESDAKGIVKFLKEKDVEVINFLILSHYDKDHIGGVSGILENFKIEKIIEPYYSGENDNIRIMNSKFKDLDIATLYPTHNRRFDIGGISIFVYPPLEKRYANDNNYSIATLIVHKNVKMLFPGDALYKRINELLEINWVSDINLLKIPYHGRQVENSELLIKTISPEFAVITAEMADQSIKDACNEIGADIFYTRKENVQFISDGQVLNVLEEPK